MQRSMSSFSSGSRHKRESRQPRQNRKSLKETRKIETAQPKIESSQSSDSESNSNIEVQFGRNKAPRNLNKFVAKPSKCFDVLQDYYSPTQRTVYDIKTREPSERKYSDPRDYRIEENLPILPEICITNEVNETSYDHSWMKCGCLECEYGIKEAENVY